jgi:hypothetical protein
MRVQLRPLLVALPVGFPTRLVNPPELDQLLHAWQAVNPAEAKRPAAGKPALAGIDTVEAHHEPGRPIVVLFQPFTEDGLGSKKGRSLTTPTT